MNNKIKKSFKSFVVIMALMVVTTTVFATQYKKLYDGERVLVVDVIDANALLVKTSTGEPAFVRILGIDSSESELAKTYAENLIEGEIVTVRTDSSYPSLQGRWNYMHVYKGNESVAETLLKTGLVKIDKQTLTSSTNQNYMQSESTAKQEGYGIWNDGFTNTNNRVSANAININTASKDEINDMLKEEFGDEYSEYKFVSTSIINYRRDNYFNTIDELKFVDNMTKEIYDDLRSCFTVVTNINTAQIPELESLINISNSEAKDIQKYIRENGHTTFSELYKEDVISKADYESNEMFVTSSSDNKLDATDPDVIVNVNTASEEQLEDAGVSSSDAEDIVEELESGFTFKNLTEVYEHDDINISKDEYIAYEDNLTFVTNINNASKSEIESLFGDDYKEETVDKIIKNRPIDDSTQLIELIGKDEYDKIKSNIKFDDEPIEYFNINTVTKDELREKDIDESSIKWILNKQGRIYDMEDLSDDLLEYDSMFTIYTNINNVTSKEIQSLDDNITTSLADKIVRDARRERFASEDEIEEIFEDKDLEEEFYDIRKYICFK